MFTFDDCLNGGRDKAAAAAEAVTKIFPAVNTKAVTLTVPMPAHPISASTEAEIRKQYNQLEELIERCFYRNLVNFPAVLISKEVI